MAYCLFIPIPLMQGQQIYHRALPVDWIWRSDLDVLFGLRNVFVQSPIQPFSPSGQSLNLLPSKTLGSQSSLKESPRLLHDDKSTWDDLRAISPEFFNLAIAFLILSLRYPSVFWYTNRGFSFVFSLLLLLTGVNALLECCATSILVRLGPNQFLLLSEIWPTELKLLTLPNLPPSDPTAEQKTVKTSESTGIDKSDQFDILAVESNFTLNIIGPLALSFIGTILFLCLFITMFEYGYHQFTENLAAYRHYLIGSCNGNGYPLANGGSLIPNGELMERRSNCGLNVNGLPSANLFNHTVTESVHSGQMSGGKSTLCLGTGVDTNGWTTRKIRSYGYGAEMLHNGCRCYLYSYAPHICAMIGSLFVLSFKIPIMWDCIMVYRITRHSILLFNVISGIIVIFAWFIAWFAFTLKPAWKFQVNLPLQTVSSPGVMTAGFQPMTFIPPVNYQPVNDMIHNSMLNSQIRQMATSSNYGISVNGTNSRLTNTLNNPNSTNIHTQMTMLGSTDDGFMHTDVNGSQAVGVPASPIYACFHDRNTGFYGVSASASSIGLPMNAQILVTPEMLNNNNTNTSNLVNSPIAPIHQVNNNADTRNTEYAIEDAEAGSRQSGGNNYVCLQSALNSNNISNIGQTILVTGNNNNTNSNNNNNDCIGLSTLTPVAISSSTSQVQYPTVNLYSGRLNNNNNNNDITTNNTQLSSSSSGHGGIDDDENSMSTIQPTNKIPIQDGSTYQGFGFISPKVPHSNSFTIINRFPNPTSTDSRTPPTTESYGNFPRISMSSELMHLRSHQNPSVLSSSECGLMSISSHNAGNLLNSNNLASSSSNGPRVTFKDDIHSNSGTTSYNQNVSGLSHTTTIEGNSIEDKTSDKLGAATFGSGPYDNAFPTTFRSSVLIKSHLQNVGKSQTPDSTGLAKSSNIFMNSSGYLRHGNIAVNSNSNTNCNNSNLYSLYPNTSVNQSAIAEMNENALTDIHNNNSKNNQSTRITGSSCNSNNNNNNNSVMIGDTFINGQPNSMEELPLLLTSHLSTDDTQETRLCSQV
ncbi:Lysine-specific demethylase 6A [Schistosoma japonicum]|nr:Lysine-specific demethylase 6A [Schistosoma japonicum]